MTWNHSTKIIFGQVLTTKSETNHFLTSLRIKEAPYSNDQKGFLLSFNILLLPVRITRHFHYSTMQA